jgi:hypothetical protein
MWPESILTVSVERYDQLNCYVRFGSHVGVGISERLRPTQERWNREKDTLQWLQEAVFVGEMQETADVVC